MNTDRTKLSHRPMRFAAGLTLLLLSAGCFVPHAQMVRDAQDAFSAGAQLENQKKLGDATGWTQDGARNYVTAVGLIDQAVSASKSALVSDDLYGTAMTVRALASWRLGDTAAAMASAKEVVEISAAESPSTKIWPRDLAVCTAIDGLIQIDAMGVTARGFDLRTTSSVAESKLMRFAVPVRSKIRKASELVPEGHPLRLYLASSECELAYVLFTGLNKMDFPKRSDSHVGTYVAFRDEALTRLKAAADAEPDPATKEALSSAASRYENDLGDVAGPGS